MPRFNRARSSAIRSPAQAASQASAAKCCSASLQAAAARWSLPRTFLATKRVVASTAPAMAS